MQLKRRTLIKALLSVAAALPFRRVQLRAQAIGFAVTHAEQVRDLAAAVLPESLGRPATDEAADQFLRWLRNYRPETQMEHGYGFTRLQWTPASPAEGYARQLEALDRAAAARGDSFSRLTLTARRSLVTAAFAEAGIENLPSRPTGQHIAADVMTFYFRGSDANDLCYRAEIARYACRGLDGSWNPPSPLHGG